MTTLEQRNVFEVAEAIAAGWERQRPRVEEICTPVRTWMLRELAARRGDVVLELAAGVGDTGFEAAAALGPEGRLVSTDFSPAMVAAARRRADALGLTRVELRVMDAQQIELEDGSVDGVLCRYGFMLMRDPAAALAEARRVLRPGGRLVLAVWGPPERNPYMGVLGALLVERGHLPAPSRDMPTPFDMGDADRTRALLEDAGFSSVRTEWVHVRFPFRDLDDYIGFVGDTAGPVALVVRALPADELAVVRSRLATTFAPFASGTGFVLPGVTLAAVAA